MEENTRQEKDTMPSLRRQSHRDEIPERLQSRLRAMAAGQTTDGGLTSLTYPPRRDENTGYTRIKQQLHDGLIEILNPQAVANASLQQVEAAIREYVANSLRENEHPLSSAEREQLHEDLLYEVMGLGPLTPLMADPTVTDILVNGPDHVYVERKGLLEKTMVRFHDADHLMVTIERILLASGRRVDEAMPLADARLADGSRVHVIIPPVAVNGPTLSIRRFAVRKYSLSNLVSLGALSEPAAEFLRLAARGRLNILISGGTGAGKTTFLNSLAENISERERIVTIEDTAELRLPHEHLVTLEARPPNVEGKGEISIRTLVRNALRMRPDRIIVGESRGPEALDMMQAMNTGHDGSMTTIHANSPRDALARLETMMLMADVELPQRVLRDQIGAALHLIVQLARLPDGSRKVMNITEIAGVDNSVVLTQDLFLTRREEAGMVMRPTGIVPGVTDVLYQNDIKLDEHLFRI